MDPSVKVQIDRDTGQSALLAPASGQQVRWLLNSGSDMLESNS
jgi:hypothetical protein